MSFRAYAWALDQDPGDALAKYVLLILADYYNDEEREAWPSLHTLARVTLLSEASVKRKLDYLESKQLITRRQVKTSKEGWTNTHYALPPLAHSEPRGLAHSEPRDGSHRAKPLAQAEPLTLSTTSTSSSRSGAGVLDATSLPPDWTPDPDDIAWAGRRHPNVELAHETDRFRDYFLSSGHRRASWPACFREWIRRADRPRPVREGPGRNGQLEARRPRSAATDRDALNRARLARARRELAGDPAPDPGMVEPE